MTIYFCDQGYHVVEHDGEQYCSPKKFSNPIFFMESGYLQSCNSQDALYEGSMNCKKATKAKTKCPNGLPPTLYKGRYYCCSEGFLKNSKYCCAEHSFLASKNPLPFCCPTDSNPKQVTYSGKTSTYCCWASGCQESTKAYKAHKVNVKEIKD